MLKIRLSRQGRKKRPFYWLVAADVRAPRDGRFVEKLGTYDPLQKVVSISVKPDRLMYWMFHGAQLTDKVRHLLSASGLLLLKHLLEGLKRGCVAKEVAQKRFKAWEKLMEKRKVPRVHCVSSLPLSSLIEDVEVPEVAKKAPKPGKKVAKKVSKKI